MAVDDEDKVLRWVEAGGTVAILDPGPPTVVSLCRCDGGEEMERLVTTDADLIALVAHLAG